MGDIFDNKNVGRKQTLVIGALLFLLTVMVFANTFENDFVGYDDQNLITNNDAIRNLSFGSVAEMFVPKYKGNYQPIRALSYALDYALWGERPFGFHLTNLILHAATVVGVWLLIRKLFAEPVALLAAVIFAIHPIHVESVTWMSGRKDVLSLFFFLPAIIWFDKSEVGQKRLPYVASILAAALALLSKLTAVSLPLCMLLLWICRDGWPKMPELARKAVRLAPHFLVVFLVIGLNFLRADTGTTHGDSLGGLDSLGGSVAHDIRLSMPLVVCRYLGLLLVPYRLSTHYDVSRISEIFDMRLLIPVVFILTVAAAGIICFMRGQRAIAFCVGWFFLTFLPASNIVPTAVMMGDRYMHVPSIAFAALLAAGMLYPLRMFAHNVKPSIRLAVLFPVLVAVLLLSVLTIRRNGDWRDTMTLFTRTRLVNPQSMDALLGIGAVYDGKGDYESAINAYRQALEIEPDHYRVLYNIGVSYLKKGWFHQANQALEKSRDVNPSFPASRVNLALSYHKQKRYEEAIAEHKEALRLDPENAVSHGDLGRIYMETGLTELALTELNRALRIQPILTQALFDRATLFGRLGRKEEAEKDLQQLESLGLDVSELRANVRSAAKTE